MKLVCRPMEPADRTWVVSKWARWVKRPIDALFITPVAYSANVISGKWQFIYSLNPMAGVVNGFRWALLGADTSPGPQMWISVAVSLVVLVSGLFYFRNMEKTFADTI